MEHSADEVADGFSIRPADSSDQAAIRGVLTAVRREYGVCHEGRDVDGDLADIAGNYFAAGGIFEVVVDVRGAIVGCAGLRPLSARRAEMCKMYLLPAARGRGLGRRLLEDMLGVARHSGFAEVWLETNSILTKAISLYTRYGFEPVAAEHLPCKCDQAYLLRLG